MPVTPFVLEGGEVRPPLMPSVSFTKIKGGVIGNGVVLDPAVLLEEIWPRLRKRILQSDSH